MSNNIKTAKLYGSKLDITLTESKMQNVWWHPDFEELFALTKEGFRIIPGSRKSSFIKHGFIPNPA